MTPSVPNVSKDLRVRVANFSRRSLAGDEVLDLGALEHDAVGRRLRSHTDLPYVFVVDEAAAGQLPELLSELGGQRSRCYPYALFSIDGAGVDVDDPELDVIAIEGADSETILRRVRDYAADRLRFDRARLRIGSAEPLPDQTGVIIIGAGITGLYAAEELRKAQIPFCVLEKQPEVGGIWSQYANRTSQVNTSEGAYRLFDKPTRANRDHSFTREMLGDLAQLASGVSGQLFLETEVRRIEKTDSGYRVAYRRGDEAGQILGKGVLLAINDRVGPPRQIAYAHQEDFGGVIVSGISDDARHLDWRDQNVVVVGMGAFAVENARTALEAGARHVTVVCRRHGTVCPKIIDHLNFTTPYDEEFSHPKRSNTLNMMYWKKLYELSGATEPECWLGELKHDGHTVSVSDIWFIAHHLKKLQTVTGEITRMTERGVVVNGQHSIEADVVVSCIGFETNAQAAQRLSGYDQTYNNNYLDKDFMYLADAHIDADAFNSLFGSSVLEMVKFYIALYIRFYDSPEYDRMIRTEGIEQIAIDDRKWSDYIRAAMALIRHDPQLREFARAQVSRRTDTFLEAGDLEAYIADNKREWDDTHTLLAGHPVPEADRLPYVFERLLKRARRPRTA